MAGTLFYSKMNKKIRKPVFLLGYMLSAIFFCALLYFGCLEVLEEIEMNARTEAIDLPVYIFTGAMPVASLFILGRIFFRVRDDLRNDNY